MTVPAFVLAFLGVTSPGEVTSWLEPEENLICWQAPERGLCLPYRDDGTHITITLRIDSTD